MKRVILQGLVIALCAVGLSVTADEVKTRVSLTSQPSGATIIVDGMDRGVTPLTLFDLTPGRHHVKFRLAGYVERDRFINTADGPFIEKNEVMVEEKGLLLLKTDPEGCSISIDGVSAGVTPRLITHLAAKDSYTVKLRKTGYQDQTLMIKFDGRKPLVREEKMILASGKLSIMSEPAGAEVTVNGIVRGVTPLTVSEVPRGRAVVKFRMEGFAEEVRELVVNAGDSQTLPIVLKGLPGTLHLTSVPEGARFYINDEAKGKGPIVLQNMKSGEYRVRAELEGYGVCEKTITLDNGGAASEEFRLSNVMGRLEVRTIPAGAAVIFDGKPLGMTKSQGQNAEKSAVFAIENILEGEHTLVVRADGYAESVRHPKIKSSKTSKANIALKRLFVPDIEIVTARGSYVGVLVSNTPDMVTVEVSLGITRSFPRDEIRKINFLKPSAK